MQYDLTGNEQRVLSLYITSKGFSFAFFEKATKLIDWQNVSVQSKNFIPKLEKIIDTYTPEVIILEDYKSSRRKRSKKICQRLDLIYNLLEKKDLFYRKYSSSMIKGVFDCFDCPTKYDRAKLVSQWLPELESSLPEKPKIWMKKPPRMGVFEAVFLAIAYFYTI